VALPRTAADSVLFTTYNVLDLFLSEGAVGVAHYEQVVAAIRQLNTDVLAVQEIRGRDADVVGGRLRQLAADVGMRCLVPAPSAAGAGPGVGAGGASRPALAMGSRGFHCGLLWRGGIEPVPGSLRALGRGHFWHSLATVTLDVGGRQVRHGAFHATPFGRLLRADQNERLVAMLTGPRGSLPLLVGADWNTESADRLQDPETGRWELYEPRDPYAGVPWFDDMLYQCEWDYGERGERRHWADRRPGDVLWAGGLHDAAAALRAPWQPTVGHHPYDRYGAAGIARRIDAIRVTRHVLGALRAYHVTDTELTRGASDHLPVTVEYDPAAVDAADPAGRP
jgi:endonuclease/exonuclease/phosphatase family metal-dependent hydrolase